MRQTVVDEDLLLRVGGHGTLRTFVRRTRVVGLLLDLRQQLVVEVLRGVVLVQVRLPPERLGSADGAGVENLTACCGEVEGGLELYS